MWRRSAWILASVLVLLAIQVIGGSGPSLGASHPNGFPAVGAVRFFDDGSGSAAARWGRVDCARPTRVRHRRAGGASEARLDGRPRASDGYRRLRVLDGDSVYGERCELGLNDWRSSPVALYREGEHLVTFASLRLPPQFPLSSTHWQTVLQMKQSQPSAGGGGAPVLELQARNGRWLMLGDWHGFWSGRVRTGVWTRFAFDVSYSQDPALGSIRIYADLNGDGDALDKGEKSRVYHRATLRRETTGGWSGTASSPAPRSRHISVLASTTTRSTAASAIAARSGWTT